MIVNNVKVYGLEESIKRAKYPMSTDIERLNSELTIGIKALGNSKIGSGHDNFLNGIVVQFDLTFTVKAWTEMQRYHFIDFISSQSTMHRITKFDLDKAYSKYVDNRIVDIIKEKVANYNVIANDGHLDSLTEEELKAHRDMLAKMYLEILYSNPCGFKLTAGMTTNYRQLRTIYHQRKSHRLPEWREFCDFIVELPMFKELCLGGENNE